jgi:predicted RNA-binding Zn-ribbon protein involved in translation (DUF1610 family)
MVVVALVPMCGAVLQEDEEIMASKKQKEHKCPGCGATLQSDDPHSIGYKYTHNLMAFSQFVMRIQIIIVCAWADLRKC